jgi:rod shape-determining protein MreC
MQKLFYFFYRYRAFLFFILLEIVCFTLIINNNSYQGSSFFNSSNYYSGELLQFTSNISGYFNLKSVNEELAKENAVLHHQLNIEKNKKSLYIPSNSDYLRIHQFKFYSAKVINSSTSRFANYLTLNKGTADSIKPNMGVISSKGIVGRVSSCSEHFSTVISLLHDRWQISAKIKRGNIDGFIKWDGKNPRNAELLHVGRHHKLKINDTVVTSGYSAYFPEGITIGTIQSYEVDQGQPSYKITVELSTDFSKLSYVYLIENNLKIEKDSLELTTQGKPE